MPNPRLRVFQAVMPGNPSGEKVGTLKKSVEVAGRYSLEAGHGKIAPLKGGKFVRRGDADHLHGGATCRFNADKGILDDNATVGGKTQSGCPCEKNLRIRLSTNDIAAADHLIKIGVQTSGSEECVEIFPRSGGTDRPGNPLSFQCGQKFHGSGQDEHPLVGNKLAVKFFLPIGEEADPPLVCRPPQSRNNDFVFLPKSLEKMPRWKFQARFRSKQFPGPFVLGRGVNHDAIPVKKDTPWRIHAVINSGS